MMRLSFAAVLAFAATVLADVTPGFDAITKPGQGESVPAGSKYQIVWQPSAAHPGAITLGLLGGASAATLSVVGTIAKGVDGSAGSYSWTVPSDATLATYGIIITLESDTSIFQYSFPFKISGGGGGAVPAPTTSSTPKPDPPSTSSSADKPSTSSNLPDAITSPSPTSSSSPPAPPTTVTSSTSSSNIPTTAVSSSSELGSSSLSGSTTITSSTTTSDVPTGTSTGISQDLATGSSGLSTGAIAGIAVGVILVVLVLAAAVVFAVCRRRRRRGGPHPSVGELDDDPRGGGALELAAAEKVEKVPELDVTGAAAASELGGETLTRRVPELSGETLTRRVPELGGSAVTAPVELPQDSRNNGPPVLNEVGPVEASSSSYPNTNQPASPEDLAVGDLLARQSRLDERRQRLLELEQIDREQDAIQHQLSVLQPQQQQPVTRYEMPE